MQTTSKNYVPDTTKWKVVYEPMNQIKNKSSEDEFEENDSDDEVKEKGKCLLKMKKK